MNPVCAGLRVALLAAALASCAAHDLATPVAGFRQATGEAKTALEKQQLEIDRAILAHALDAVIAGRAGVVRWRPDECGDGAERCRLFVVLDDREWPLNQAAIEHAVVELMAGIAAYAVALEGIANADTAAKIQTAANTTKANIIAFGGNIDEIRKTLALRSVNAKAVATAYASPVVDIVSFGLQKYVRHLQISALRAAVNQMESIFGMATDTFEAVALQARTIRLAVLDTKFIDAEAERRRHPTDKARLKALSDIADQYDAALKVKPEAVFANLRKAHTALADALDNRDLSFDQLWPYLQEVFKDTTRLAALIKQLEDASSKT